MNPDLSQSRFRRSILLVLLYAAPLLMGAQPSLIQDGDIWWHLRAGESILHNHGVPRVDFLSSYTMGKPWVDYSWLFDAGSALLYRAWGLRGIFGATVVLMTAIAIVLQLLISRYERNFGRSVLITLLALAAISPLYTPRPWLITILFFIIEMDFLLRARKTGKWIWIVSLIPMFVLWANVHIQFVYGLFLAGLFVLESFFAWVSESRGIAPQTRLSLGMAVTALGCWATATLANPYGAKVYSVVLEYANQKAPLRYIEEMQPPRFRTIAEYSMVLLAFSAVFVLGKQRKSLVTVIVLLMPVAIWLGFRTIRDIWFLAITSAVALALHSTCSSSGYAPQLRHRAMIVLGVVLLGIGIVRARGVTEASLDAAVARAFPSGAALFVETHALKGPLYNGFDWGGYLSWRLPNLAVSIDGRANLQGDEHFDRSVATWRGRKDWSSDPELMRSGIVIADINAPLASLVKSSPRFRLLYEDSVAAVFGAAEAGGEQAGNTAVPRQ